MEIKSFNFFSWLYHKIKSLFFKGNSMITDAELENLVENNEIIVENGNIKFISLHFIDKVDGYSICNVNIRNMNKTYNIVCFDNKLANINLEYNENDLENSNELNVELDLISNDNTKEIIHLSDIVLMLNDIELHDNHLTYILTAQKLGLQAITFGATVENYKHIIYPF